MRESAAMRSASMSGRNSAYCLRASLNEIDAGRNCPLPPARGKATRVNAAKQIFQFRAQCVEAVIDDALGAQEAIDAAFERFSLPGDVTDVIPFNSPTAQSSRTSKMTSPLVMLANGSEIVRAPSLRKPRDRSNASINAPTHGRGRLVEPGTSRLDVRDAA